MGTQLKAQGPSRICNESKEEKEEVDGHGAGDGGLALDLNLFSRVGIRD